MRLHQLCIISMIFAANGASWPAFASPENRDFLEISKWSSPFHQKLSELSSDYVVLQIWSPFCESCSEEVTELNALLQSPKASQNKIAVLGIPIQSRTREIQAFVDHFKPKYEQWLPDRAFLASLATFSPEATIPLTVLLGKNRQLLHQWRGKVVANELTAAIAQADAAKDPKNSMKGNL